MDVRSMVHQIASDLHIASSRRHAKSRVAKLRQEIERDAISMERGVRGRSGQDSDMADLRHAHSPWF
jgi:hypothetical protein